MFTLHAIEATKPPSGDKTGRGRFSFQVVWRLESNSADDGPDEAIDYVEQNIARLGDIYRLEAIPLTSSSSSSSSSPGPITVDHNLRAELTKISPSKEPRSAAPWVWFVTLTYETPAGASPDPQDPGAGNPLDLLPEIDIQTIQYQRPVEKAVYVEGYTGHAHTLLSPPNPPPNPPPDPVQRPVMNSALSIFDPPPEHDDHRWVIRIKRNVRSLDCDLVKCNVINDQPLVIEYRGIRKSIAKYQGKTRDVSAQPAYHFAIGWYVEVQFYIDVDDKYGWRLSVLDRGFSARYMDGDPDGKGGQVSGTGIQGVTDGTCPQRRLLDAIDRTPISEPVLLNGDGQPLHEVPDTNPPTPKDPIYGVWKDYEEDDFNSWPILAGLLGAVSSPGP